MAFDAEDNLYLTDSLNHRVQKFTKDGKFLAKWGEEGNGPGQFNMPWGITLDRQGNVYVADWRNDRVQKFDSSGRFIAEWDGQGGADDRFNRPSGLAVDDDGDIYVCDWGNERVQVLSPAGETLTSFRGDSITSTWSRAYFEANPEEGRGTLGVRPGAGSGALGERSREISANVEKLLWGPTAVKVDSQGRIYIVDSSATVCRCTAKGSTAIAL